MTTCKRENRLFRFFVLALIAGVSFYYLAVFCNRETDSFSIVRIHSDLPFNPEWETTPLSAQKKEEVLTALDQKFSYLGCGGQCFAFASEDGNYVIKFFKHKIRAPYSFFLKMALPGPLEKKRLGKLNKALYKLHRDFNSYKIAYEDLQDETGLLYIHLNKGTSLNQKVTIIDKIGIAHQIPLDEVEFVVQKRGQLAYSYIENLMEQGDDLGARAALHSILDIIICRCKKGVYDEDAKIHRNLGFVGAKPIFIDVGRFTRDPERTQPLVYKNDVRIITKRLRAWLEESHPQLTLILDEELHEIQNQN